MKKTLTKWLITIVAIATYMAMGYVMLTSFIPANDLRMISISPGEQCIGDIIVMLLLWPVILLGHFLSQPAHL